MIAIQEKRHTLFNAKFKLAFLLFVAMLLVVTLAQSSSVSQINLAQPKLSKALVSHMALNDSETVNVLIQTETHDYAAIVAAIEEAGGTVSHQYKYATGLAAKLPGDAITAISEMAGIVQVSMDSQRSIEAGSTNASGLGDVIPLGSDMATIDEAMRAGVAFPFESEFDTMTIDALALENPATYANPDTMNAFPVWGTGNMGQDSLSVVIDTGVYSDHFMLAGRVVDGIDISTDVGTEFEGFDLATNHYHGTHVAGILGGSGAIVVPNDDLLVQSIEYYTGAALPAYDADNKLIPLLGMAPATQFYGIKVFDHTGGSTPESTIIAAIEHAIDLHVNGTYDVDVINMSLGGGQGYDGRDLEDMTVDYATSVGISVVVAAGNDGPTSLTTGSPGTANTAITAGAVAHPINTRVFWDLNYGAFGIGDFLFTSDDPQMIYFSSRGPTADGRDKPTVSAVGVFVLSALTGDPGALGFASGTSMATPATAGVTALLNTYGETVGASPFDYKEALIAGSSPLPLYDHYDQGAGFIDAADAMAALVSDSHYGSAEAPLEGRGPLKSVAPKGMLIHPESPGGATLNIHDLAPGDAEHFYFPINEDAGRITIEFTDVDLGDDPLLFNSFEVYLQSASRSFNNAYIDTTNVYGDATMVVEELSTTVSGDVFGVATQDLPMMPGYVRFVVENDWTTFDSLSGTVHIKVDRTRDFSNGDEFYSGTIANGADTGYFPVGHGPDGVELKLSWEHHWAWYPAADLDMVVAWIDTDGNVTYELGGATLNSPEMVRLEADNIDEVYVLVDGFQTYVRPDEDWELEVNYLGD